MVPSANLLRTDDALSDDAMDSFPNPIMLPTPELRNLGEIDNMMRIASGTPQGRDSLSKFIISEDYVTKLVPLVEMAEDLEALSELHRLSNIMKMLILLNDTHIIETVVSDANVLGVVGALECK
jgi:protein phosphatase-4 regulatory subunit 3